MPVQQKNEDGTEVTLYTAEDIEAAKREAATTAATAERDKLTSDPNGIAAVARRDAERKLRDKQKELDAVQAQLAESGKTTEEITALKAKAADAYAERDKALQGIEAQKAEHARDLSLIAAGVKPERLARLKSVLTADGVDLANESAVTKAIADAKAEAPGWFTASGGGDASAEATSAATPAAPVKPAQNGVSASPTEAKTPDTQAQFDAFVKAGNTAAAIALQDSLYTKE